MWLSESYDLRKICKLAIYANKGLIKYAYLQYLWTVGTMKLKLAYFW